jgi:(1->4)-alpha-D-glucan 1-alpha-D-glucosylmutase
VPSEFELLYRLQLTPEFGFAAARALVPYLERLGVSHLYLSPSFEARPGSTHGYDVTDPRRIREELGGEEEFRALAEAAPGIVLDIVPNHMATDELDPFWPDPRVFDIDRRTGVYRRFFDVGELAGVRVEDPLIFELTQGKAIELVREGLVDGLRIDHPDGLVDPRGYLERLRDQGVEHVWVEKILEPGERLRDWATEGTTGYEFLNDAMHLHVDPRAEEQLTRLYADFTGEQRDFHAIADEAKLEQARTTFEPEVERLRRLWPDAPELERSLAALRVYRTYVEPWSGRIEDEDRRQIEAAGFPAELARALLLEERGRDEFVTRFQQTTGAVHAKGVEDTAFYRYLRLVALNEVGGDPGRFGLGIDEFHRANLERRPRALLTTYTHDTKRSPDVRARLVALTWIPDEWERLVRGVGPGEIDPNDAYLALQTVVGAWPLTAERLDLYLEKALREGKRTSSWLEPDEQAERRVKDYAAALLRNAEVERFVERVRPLGEQIALGMLALKLTSPGVPDLYQGDELETLALVDPDNRRPVDWAKSARALDDPPPKLALILQAAALRSRLGAGYEPLDRGPDVVAFRRGEVEVAVPVRESADRPTMLVPSWQPARKQSSSP